MANRLTHSIFAIVILSTSFSACKNNDVTPQDACTLTVANDEQNQPMQTFTYDAQKRLNKFIFDEGDTQVTFTYNAQNQVDKMNLRLFGEEAEEFGNILPFTLTYDADGNLNKAVVIVFGTPVNINYLYTNKKVSSITRSYSDGAMTITDKYFLEYNGANISRVYQQVGGRTIDRVLVTRYDTKKNVYPTATTIMFLAFAGIDSPEFLTDISQNNAISYKFLDDDSETIYNIVENTWTYNSNNYPKKRVSNLTYGSRKETNTLNYLYSNCK